MAEMNKEIIEELRNKLKYEREYNESISKEIELMQHELEIKQHRLMEMRYQIFIIKKTIETCENDTESLTNKICDLEIKYHETCDKIKTLEKDLEKAIEYKNKGGLELWQWTLIMLSSGQKTVQE